MLCAALSALFALVAGVLGAQPGSAHADSAGAAVTAHAAARAPLRDGTALYPRAIRLAHNGAANGRVLASVVTFSGKDGLGAIHESTDQGASFREVGIVRDPQAAAGKGLCCATLYELPRAIGPLPAGTLLWAASVGQDTPDRRMTLRVFKSNDVGRTWSYLSTIATAPNTRGLWEPEFSLDTSGRLVAHYSDETDPAHSQKLVAARTSDGRTWTGHHDTIASRLASDRPGMAVVRRLGTGPYVMSYEICAPSGQYACVVHYRTSADGWNWGDPAHLGFRPETADGRYFKHAPNLAWSPEPGNPDGRLYLIGQVLHERDGTRAPDSGRTVWTNSRGGTGTWQEIPAPVTVTSPTVDYCPNYSSALLPSAEGNRLLEIATDWDGGVCRAYFATGAASAARSHRLT
ncbi:exo-alpha-sialidase [Streptomyces sp. ODS28]|uniref:exo-alpha-sialidase n=1 Tax=Streptomyces sp. ODS28 TaxID=3136688 RepID=UPI0031E96E3A